MVKRGKGGERGKGRKGEERGEEGGRKGGEVGDWEREKRKGNEKGIINCKKNERTYCGVLV